VVTGAAGLIEQFSAEVAARHVSLVAAAPLTTTGALAIDAAPAGSDRLETDQRPINEPVDRE